MEYAAGIAPLYKFVVSLYHKDNQTNGGMYDGKSL